MSQQKTLDLYFTALALACQIPHTVIARHQNMSTATFAKLLKRHKHELPYVVFGITPFGEDIAFFQKPNETGKFDFTRPSNSVTERQLIEFCFGKDATNEH